MTSKEALERLNKHFNLDCYSFDSDENSKVTEYSIIKQDLDRLEQLERGNQVLMNKALELSAKLTKYKKALDILKDKVVNIPQLLKTTFIVYNSLVLLLGYDKLTQEEYELLKSVLDC